MGKGLRRGITAALALMALAALAAVHPASPLRQYLPSLPFETHRAQKAVRNAKPRLAGELEKKGLRLGAPLFIRIYKTSAPGAADQGRLEAWLRAGDGKYVLLRAYPVCARSGRLGPKLKEGDRQSPEGFYMVGPERMNPRSRYHLSFNLGFPNAHDRANGWTGSFLMVHGKCVSIGCYAMTDPVIEDIWTLMQAAFREGEKRVPVHIFPFPMSDENLERWMKEHPGWRWAGFWRELQEGWRMFEQTRTPPAVSTRAGHYVFKPPR